MYLSIRREMVVWKWGHGKTFSTKECYFFLSHELITTGFPNFWRLSVLEKTKIFNWLLLRNKILTTDNLRQGNLNSPFRCPLCIEEDEMVRHLFLECKYTRGIWQQVTAKTKTPTTPKSMEEL